MRTPTNQSIQPTTCPSIEEEHRDAKRGAGQAAAASARAASMFTTPPAPLVYPGEVARRSKP